MNVDFDAVFGSQGANNDVKPAAGKVLIKGAFSEHLLCQSASLITFNLLLS